MQITRKKRESFDFINTIKKINKMNGSPSHLSKENNILLQNKDTTQRISDPIFNENIPIKVRLIKAAHLNPNINFNQIKNIQKKKDVAKTEIADNNEPNQIEPKIISVKKNKFSKIKILSTTDTIKKDKEKNESNQDLNTNNKNNNIKLFKYNYIKKNIIEKEKEDDNIENVDFERKTYETNITKTNYIKKKNKSIFKAPATKLAENDDQYSSKKILNTEGGGLYKGRGIFSSDNIFSAGNEYNNIGDKSVNNDNISNKLYDLNTVVAANNENNKKEKINSPISVQTYNNTNSYNITNNNYKYIYLNPKNNKSKNNINYNNDNNEIKLDDLILFEEKLNDIYIALNTKNVCEEGASNECVEFISFYFHSSLKNHFTYFFNGMNKVIIKSAINLILYTVCISYHLSLNPAFLNKLNRKLKKIFLLLKLNLYLFIKKIQLYYGEKFTKKNDVYFRNFNYILIQEGIYNCNESKIVNLVNKNCYEIVSNLEKILDFYKSVENIYYQDFLDIFSSISKINEIDIHNYFYSHLFNNSSLGKPKPRSNITKIKNKFSENKSMNYSVNIETKENAFDRSSIPLAKISNDLLDINALVDNDIKLFSKSKQENNLIFNYEKNRAYPPFLKNKNQKKFTLILDLEETLIHINEKGECLLRPGLYKFLKEVKPYYELVSFSNESKYTSEPIIDIIEEKKKYFDYNLYREHLTFSGKEFIKDLSKLGRNIKNVIIVDNIANNFKLNPENGIQISPFFGDDDEDDVLEELKNILITFIKEKYDDLRIGIKKYKKFIRNNITKDYNK